MKKFTILFAALIAWVLPTMAQSVNEPDVDLTVEGTSTDSAYVLVADSLLFASMTAQQGVSAPDSSSANDLSSAQPIESANNEVANTQVAEAEVADAPVSDSTSDQQSAGDEIELKYVPNRFVDNWEINLAGGVSLLFSGMGHDKAASSPHVDAGGNETFWDALGGRAEITATKWFSPYAAMRIGWTTGWMPFEASQKPSAKSFSPIGGFDNYVHVDALWDWTSQFGGYNPNRIYDAVPYLHVGVVANPLCNAAIGGGAGFLNRFRVAEHWLINLDLRGLFTTARKYGVESGIAIDVQALVGVTYRFNKVGWKKTVENPYKSTLEELRAANEELDQKRAQVEQENEKLDNSLTQREQERKELAQLVAAITKDTVFYGVPDTMQLTVYYGINSADLSAHEKAHMNTYLRLIGLNDPNYIHIYKVVGTADAGTGAKEVNESLCRRRAETIKNVLIESGVDPENISTEIEIVDSDNAQLARASHVIIYPVEKPKVVIPDTVNLDVDDEE